MHRSVLSKGLIIATVLLIGAFQCYWITKLYKQEREALRRETDVLFRDAVYQLQLQRFKNDTAFFKLGEPNNLFAFDVMNEVKSRIADSMLTRGTSMTDTGHKRIIMSLRTQNLHEYKTGYIS